MAASADACTSDTLAAYPRQNRYARPRPSCTPTCASPALPLTWPEPNACTAAFELSALARFDDHDGFSGAMLGREGLDCPFPNSRTIRRTGHIVADAGRPDRLLPARPSRMGSHVPASAHGFHACVTSFNPGCTGMHQDKRSRTPPATGSPCRTPHGVEKRPARRTRYAPVTPPCHTPAIERRRTRDINDVRLQLPSGNSDGCEVAHRLPLHADSLHHALRSQIALRSPRENVGEPGFARTCRPTPRQPPGDITMPFIAARACRHAISTQGAIGCVSRTSRDSPHSAISARSVLRSTAHWPKPGVRRNALRNARYRRAPRRRSSARMPTTQ